MSKILNFSIRNIHLHKYNNYNKFYYKNIKTFSTQNKQKEIEIMKNAIEDNILDVKVHNDYKPFYSFGNIGILPLYENTKDLSKFTYFIPAPKFNILLLSLYTYFSFGTQLFQPSLLITLYLIKKYFLTNCGKSTQVLLLGLYKDGENIFVKTFFHTYRFLVKETKITKKLTGGNEYFELTNSKIKFPLICSHEGKILNKELFETIFAGDVSKVNMIF